MISKSDVDFGKTAKDYAKHRAGFPESFFEKLKESKFLLGKNRILDLGTGTGTVARGLAQLGFEVVGLDPSADLLAEAKELDKANGVKIEYILGTAESSGLVGREFDCIIAGQCWHWFDQKAALAEIQKLLRTGGVLIIAYFDWLSSEGNPVEEMIRLRHKYNPNWKSNWPLGFYPWKPGDLIFDGFKSFGSFLYEENVAYTHEGWRGRMRAYAGIGGSLPAAMVDEFDREFAVVLKEKFPHEPMQIPHKVWVEGWLQS